MAVGLIMGAVLELVIGAVGGVAGVGEANYLYLASLRSPISKHSRPFVAAKPV